MKKDAARWLRGEGFELSVMNTALEINNAWRARISAGESPVDARRAVCWSFGRQPISGDTDFTRFTMRVIRAEAQRLNDAPMYVVEPQALEQMLRAINEGEHNSVANDIKFPADTGFVFLSEPVYQRVNDQIIRDIQALVWGPEQVLDTGNNPQPTPGFVLSTYGDPYGPLVSPTRDEIKRVARSRKPPVLLAPLFLNSSQFVPLGDIAAEVAGSRRLPSNDVLPDVPPAGKPVVDDMHFPVKLALAFRSHCQRERVQEHPPPNRASSRSTRRPNKRSASVFYVLKGAPSTEGPEPVDSATHSSRAEWLRKTRAWTVRPHTVTVTDQNGNRRTVRRAGHVRGPDRRKHTYEELREQEVRAGVVKPHDAGGQPRPIAPTPPPTPPTDTHQSGPRL